MARLCACRSARAKATIATSLRAVNFALALVGCGLIGIGVYAAIRFKGEAPVLEGAVLGIGILDALFALIIVFGGLASLFVLRLYSLLFGLLSVAEAAVAILFMLPETRDNIVSAAHLPGDIEATLSNNVLAAGGVLIGVIGLQVVALLLSLCQCSAIDPENELDEDDEAGEASGSKGLLNEDYGYLAATRREQKAAGKAGATVPAAPTSAAVERYRESHKAYADKYSRGGDKYAFK